MRPEGSGFIPASGLGAPLTEFRRPRRITLKQPWFTLLCFVLDRVAFICMFTKNGTVSKGRGWDTSSDANFLAIIFVFTNVGDCPRSLNWMIA
jgi:hypothetical protein